MKVILIGKIHIGLNYQNLIHLCNKMICQKFDTFGANLLHSYSKKMDIYLFARKCLCKNLLFKSLKDFSSWFFTLLHKNYWDDKMSIIVSLQKNVGSIIFSHPKEGKKPDFLHNCRSKFSLKNKWLAESGNLNCDHRNRSLLISLVFTKEIKITIK